MITSFETLLIDNVKDLNVSKVLVAFSGGIDSTTLLNCLNEFRHEIKFEIFAVHINHGIRGKKADSDENFCKNFCERNKIPFLSKKVNALEYAAKHKLSLEDSARKLRYRELLKISEDIDADLIFTAHHLDDKIETFFVKLFQGTSLFNLSGFNFYSEKLFRPMLDIKKEYIYEYAKSKSLNFVEDETNSDTNYLRNWIRHKILKNTDFKTHDFFKNISELQKESEELQNYFHYRLKNVEIKEEFKNVKKIDKKVFLKLHDIEKKYILSEFFKNFFRLEKKHLAEALNTIKSDVSKRISMPNNYIFEVSYNTIRIFSKNVLDNFCHCRDSEGFEINFKNLNKKLVVTNNKNALKIRLRQKGDIFKNKKLKDIFIDKKIDLFIRDISLVVENENEIIWVENISDNNDDIKVIYGE